MTPAARGAITGQYGRSRDPEGQEPALPSTNGRSCAWSRSGVSGRVDRQEACSAAGTLLRPAVGLLVDRAPLENGNRRSTGWREMMLPVACYPAEMRQAIANG